MGWVSQLMGWVGSGHTKWTHGQLWFHPHGREETRRAWTSSASSFCSRQPVISPSGEVLISSCRAHIRNFCRVKYPHRLSSCMRATLICLASSWYAEITNSPTPACQCYNNITVLHRCCHQPSNFGSRQMFLILHNEMSPKAADSPERSNTPTHNT